MVGAYAARWKEGIISVDLGDVVDGKQGSQGANKEKINLAIVVMGEPGRKKRKVWGCWYPLFGTHPRGVSR